MGEAERRCWKGHAGPLLHSKDEFEVIQCESCRFRHIIPIPSEEELLEVYRHDYYSREKPLYLERHQQDLEWWRLVYRERYEALESHLPTDRRRILDVGAGPGYFLLTGRERGWETLGVEPSSQAAAHGRGLGNEVIEAFLTEALAHRLGTFDSVHLCNVLEHVPDPLAMMQCVSGLLDPGGVVMVVVPNDENPFQLALTRACGFEPWWVAPPHHINFFDRQSLMRLLGLAHLDVLETTASFPIDLFLLMGENYIGDDELGRRCHGRRVAFERNLDSAGFGELKRRLYRVFADLGIGREVVVIARRACDG